MNFRVVAQTATLGLLVAGCASFNMGADRRGSASAPAQVAAPTVAVAPVALEVAVEGRGVIRPGSVLTLSLFDAANSAVALYAQDVADSPAAFPWSARLDAPSNLLDGGRRLALGAVVKSPPTGMPAYATETPALVPPGAPSARVTVVSTGL